MTSPTNSLGHILMGEHIHLFAPVETKTNRLWGQRFERAKKTHSKQEIPQPRMLTFPLIHSLPPGISKVARSFKFQQTEKWSLPNRGIGGYEPGRLPEPCQSWMLSWMSWWRWVWRSCSNFFLSRCSKSWELLFFKKIWITPKCRCLLTIHHSFEWI